MYGIRPRRVISSLRNSSLTESNLRKVDLSECSFENILYNS
ncbi:pentapeptide repeat-containing protein [Vibrio splendidus]